VLTTTMTTVEPPHAFTYTTTELVSCLVTPSARAYGSEGWGFESLRARIPKQCLTCLDPNSRSCANLRRRPECHGDVTCHATWPSIPADALVTSASVAQRHDFRDRADERRFAGPEPAGDDDLRLGAAPPLRVLVGHAGSFLSVHVVRRLSSSHRGGRPPANNPVSPGRRPGTGSHRAARTDERRSLRPSGCVRKTSGSGPAHHFSASAAASLWC
jgi:hypothetical protein